MFPASKQLSGFLRLDRVGVPLVVAACLLLVPVPARADCDDPGTCCGQSKCMDSSSSTKDNVQSAVKKAITNGQPKGLQETIIDYMDDIIKKYLVKLANQDTNNWQNNTNAQTVMDDRTVTNQYANAVGQARVRSALQVMPSRTACREATRSKRLSSAMFNDAKLGANGTYAKTQSDAIAYAANAPGSDSERGSLYAMNKLVPQIGDGFCDPAVIQPPAGFTCNVVNDSQGRPMAFRYTQPWLALFGVKDGLIPTAANDPENRAARLFARMAVEPVPIDPLRGPLLTRTDGQTAFLRRQSDIAAISLSRNALDRMVDERIGTTDDGSESIEYLRQKAWNDASSIASDVAERSGQSMGANLDDLAPMIGEVNKVYWQIFNNMERLAAMRATHMARVVQERRAGAGSLAGRVMSQ